MSFFKPAANLFSRRQSSNGSPDSSPSGDTSQADTSQEDESLQDWPDPKPLPARLPAPEPFDPALLPPSLRPWVLDIAERMQVPVDYVAVSAMTQVAAVVGARVGIRPKRHDSWLVVPNLWGLVVGRPGTMKSPALKAATEPIHVLERRAAKENADARKLYEAEKELMKRKEGEKSKRLDSAQTPEEVKAIKAEYEVEEPPEKRHLVNDATSEKLIEILRDNPEGVLLLRDEIAGWLASFSKAGHEGARKFYLEAWTGDGEFVQDRIGRGTIRVENVCVSILGTTQPGVLWSYLRDGLKGGRADDGLLQRFQLVVWPQVAPYENVDRPPLEEAAEEAKEAILRLAEMWFLGGCSSGDGEEEKSIPFRRFTPEAQELFDGWRTRLENRIRSKEEPPAFTSHLSKYRSLLPSLALLYHLASGGEGDVGVEAFEAARKWCAFLESHARRIYAPVLRPEIDRAYNLAEHLLKGDLDDGFTLRDLYRKEWKGLSSKEKAASAVEKLVALSWLKANPVKTGGRPTVRYYISPKLPQ